MSAASWRRALALCLLATPLAAPAARAQPQSLGSQAEVLAALGLSTEEIRREVRRRLADPEVLNAALDRVLAGTGGSPLLAGLQVRFATFEAEEGDERGLGLTYSYSRSIKRDLFGDTTATARGLDLSVSAAGNVAFERRANPRDFLESGVSLAAFRSTGGAVATTTAVRSRLDSLRQQLAAIPTEAELDASPLWKEYLATVLDHLTTQTYVDLAATVELESDQSFDRTQYVYGARLGVDVKAWNPSSRAAQWNVFDYPFALLRRLNGTDSAFAPRGTSIPTVLVSAGLVDPQDDDQRAALGESGSYPRLDAEVAFRTLLLESPAAGELYVQASARWFGEPGASRAVRDAGIDRYSYVAVALASDAGPYVSFTRGRLPVDRRQDEVYELGFKLYF